MWEVWKCKVMSSEFIWRNNANFQNWLKCDSADTAMTVNKMHVYLWLYSGRVEHQRQSII